MEVPSKLKVLLIIHTSGHGGAENTFRWLAWGLLQQGVDVIPAVPCPSSGENWIHSALSDLGINYVTFDIAGTPLRLLRNIGNLIDEIRPDLVHSHLLDSNFYCSLACRSRRIPHVATEHGDLALGLSPRSLAKYIVISFLSRVVCVSRPLEHKAMGLFPWCRRILTINNGVPAYERVISTFRKEAGIPDTAYVIGNVGNLYPVKGQKTLIQAFSEVLSRTDKDLFLVLVGRGAELESLKLQVGEQGVPSHRVIFTGFRSDIVNIMCSMDLYVQPSLSEGHPLAVLEAMSLGIPVAASSVGGIPELLLNDRGVLFPPGDSAGLMRILRHFLDDPTELREKAMHAAEYVHKELSVRMMSENYMSLYSRLIAEKLPVHVS